MSEKRTQKRSNKRNNNRKIKCINCEFYDYEMDYCTERDIDNCTRQTNVNFSKCGDFLIRENLIMF